MLYIPPEGGAADKTRERRDVTDNTPARSVGELRGANVVASGFWRCQFGIWFSPGAFEEEGESS